MPLQNPSPEIFQPHHLPQNQKQARRQLQLNDEVDDPYDELQIFELIRHINDPQYPLTLEQLNVVNPERCYMKGGNKVSIFFTPTIPHCSMAQMIGLMLKVKLLKFLPKTMKVKVYITPGTHVSEHDINKQINDKERVAAAIENPSIIRVITKCFHNSDRFQF